MASLEQRIEQAEQGGPEEIALLVHDPAVQVLEALLRNPSLSEEHLLTLLSRKNLPREILEAIARNQGFIRSQRVKAAVVLNPKTPRLVSLRLLKFLYLFDLVAVSLQPGVPADIKRPAEDQIVNRLPQLPLGQQVNLARRGSARVVTALLQLGREPVMPAALQSPFLTEAALLGLLRRDDLPVAVVERIGRHPKWSRRYDIRLQLVRHPRTPLALALSLLPQLRPADLALIASDKRMRPKMREYVKAEVGRRSRGRSP